MKCGSSHTHTLAVLQHPASVMALVSSHSSWRDDGNSSGTLAGDVSDSSSWDPNKAPCWMSSVDSIAFTTYGILHTSVKTDQLSSNRCQRGKLHGHGPAHSFLWCVTKACGLNVCVSEPSHADSFIAYWFHVYSGSLFRFPKNSCLFTVWSAFNVFVPFLTYHLVFLSID